MHIKMKFLRFTFLFWILTTSLYAQDFVIKNNDDVIRGTIKGTDFYSVVINVNDEKEVIFLAKDVKNFFWNGNSFVTKGFAGRKDLEFRFVKVVEIGTVNLYSFGGENFGVKVPKEKSGKFRPSVSIGTGVGGFGNSGLGGGLSVGGGLGNRNNDQNTFYNPNIRYFIEKPGTGPLQEIPIKAITEEDKKLAVKNILLQKMGDKPEIKAKIESNTELNSRDVTEWVKAYNEIKK
jgi:hypothetical protein